VLAMRVKASLKAGMEELYPRGFASLLPNGYCGGPFRRSHG